MGREGSRTGLRGPGALAGETRRCCGEDLLAPPLHRGEIVGRENTPIHKLDEIGGASAAAGAGVLSLPTSSPDLNPLALRWSKIKSRLRALKPRTLPD